MASCLDLSIPPNLSYINLFYLQVTKDPIICTICGRTCAYQKELDRHMVEVHKREDVQHPCAKGAPASLRDYMGHQVGNCFREIDFVPQKSVVRRLPFLYYP